MVLIVLVTGANQNSDQSLVSELLSGDIFEINFGKYYENAIVELHYYENINKTSLLNIAVFKLTEKIIPPLSK